MLGTSARSEPRPREIKTIGIVIIETGAEDGVWLESIKMGIIMERLGYRVKFFTGKHFGDKRSLRGWKTQINPLLTPRYGAAQDIYQENFEDGRPSAVTTQQDSEMGEKNDLVAKQIEGKLRGFVKSESIDLLVSQNGNAIPMHVPLGQAIKAIVEAGDLDVAGLFHNHDHAWERGDKYLGTPFPSIVKSMVENFPGILQYTPIMAINSHNQDQLMKRLGLPSFNLPNVMDFDDVNYGKLDKYNGDLLQELGIREDALLLGQVTRIVERKNIEASIALLKKLNKIRGDRRVVLVITGEESIGDVSHYKKRLEAKVERYIKRGWINKDQVVWASERIKPERGKNDSNQKLYSLSDFYAHLSKQGAMTYPSTYEGFGNAFIEAVLARVPIITNNYKPVYWPEIGSKGFKTVQMEDGRATSAVAQQTHELLLGIENEEKWVQDDKEHNWNLGKKTLSFDVAAEVIAAAISASAEMANEKPIMKQKNEVFVPKPVPAKLRSGAEQCLAQFLALSM